MKKITFLFFFSVLLVFADARAFPVRVKTVGGWGWISGGDLNRNLRAWKDFFSDRNEAPYAFSFDVEELHRTQEAALEFVYELSSRIHVGLTVEYLSGKTEGRASSSFAYEKDYFNSAQDFGVISLEEQREQLPRYHFRCIPILLTVYYSRPFLRKGDFYFGLGAGFYSGRLDYRERYHYEFDYQDEKILSGSPLIFVEQYSTTGEYSERTLANTLGLHGKVGIELSLYKGLCFVLEITGRWAEFKDWEGTKSDSFSWDHTWGFWGANTDQGSKEEQDKGKLWMVRFSSEVTGKSYPRFVFSEGKPLLSSYSEARPARIDWNGLCLRVGLAIRL